VTSDQKLGGISVKNGSSWHPSSWRNFPVQQQPEYPDKDAVKKALDELSSYPPLIFAGECRTLQSRLAKVASGEAFIVQVS
jgi:3-deoxy-7-phosphoheptulonate synthase